MDILSPIICTHSFVRETASKRTVRERADDEVVAVVSLRNSRKGKEARWRAMTTLYENYVRCFSWRT